MYENARDWFIIAFISTALFTLASWALAIAVLRSNRKQFVNRVFSLYLCFLGLWSISGLIDKVIFTKSPVFITWTYRWAYASSSIAAGLFLLFCAALYYNRKPSRIVIYSSILPSIVGCLLSLTPLVINSVTLLEGKTTVKNGSLFPLFICLLLSLVFFSFTLLFKKWRYSTGIDRARISIIFLSLSVFFLLAFVFAIVLPTLTKNQFFVNLAFLLGIIPVAGISFAIIQYRLLDVRIVIRKAGVYLIASILFALPLIIFLVVLNQIRIPSIFIYSVLTVVFLVLFFMSPRILAALRKFSARVLFSGTYDEMVLADESFSRLSKSTSLQEGISGVLEEITPALAVSKTELKIPPGVIDDNTWHFSCLPNENEEFSTVVNITAKFEDWLKAVEGMCITEELERWPKTSKDALIAKELKSRQYSFAMDILLNDQVIGYLLVGQKLTRAPITQTDVNLLEKIAERLGIFVDNYSLSAKLAAQLERQQALYRELQEAYKFKSEIMQVASHEFRTPITVASGFAHTLKDHWSRLGEEEKISFLENIVDACGRITDLTNQFLSITTLEQGQLITQIAPFKISQLIKKLCESLKPEEQERLIIEADPEIFIVSDFEHLETILKNLVDNALRFSPADKPVIIRAWKNSICDFIQVSDFGKGIPKDMTEKVFEPFVRLESVHHHSKGMGLGLYIVRLLSSQLGIEVEIDSREGEGTSVTLSISYE